LIEDKMTDETNDGIVTHYWVSLFVKFTRKNLVAGASQPFSAVNRQTAVKIKLSPSNSTTRNDYERHQ
jgi:hypothetical protein